MGDITDTDYTHVKKNCKDPNLGGIFRDSFCGRGQGGGGGNYLLSKNCYNYDRNLKFVT